MWHTVHHAAAMQQPSHAAGSTIRGSSTAVHPKEMFSCAEAGLTVHAQGVQERRPLTGSRLWLGRPDQPLLLLLVSELALELLVRVRVRVRDAG